MECDNVQNQLPFYLSGDLDEDETGAVETHLNSCPVCRREKEQLGILLGMADDVLHRDTGLAPGRFLDGVAAGVQKRRKQYAFTARLTAVAAVVMIAVGAFLYGASDYQPVGNVELTPEQEDYMALVFTEDYISPEDFSDLYEYVGNETPSAEDMNYLYEQNYRHMNAEDILSEMSEEDIIYLLASM